MKVTIEQTEGGLAVSDVWKNGEDVDAIAAFLRECADVLRVVAREVT